MKKKTDAGFRKRFEENIDELRWLYMELYHNDERAFKYFCDMLERAYHERSETLKNWDKKRTEKPGWYHDNERYGMLMYVENFDKTIQGVRDHLDYINEVGVNYLHLMPLLASPEGRSDGGYAVSDFKTVEPKYGSIEDLAMLSEECHNEDISICLDFVMNHTSEDHEWARRARKGDIECQKRYFFYDNWDIPDQFEKTVPQVFPQTAPGNFTWCEEAQKVVMTTFYPYQWDLNYANPVVFNDMTENLLYLCNKGVDIVRLDATPYIWKELGTNCRNLPQVHSLVRMMRIASEIVAPGTLLLGEIVMEPKEVVPYFGTPEKPECHLLYNVTTMASTWHTVATADVRLLRHQLGTIFALPKEYVFLNYLRCHDDIGWGLDYKFLQNFGFNEVAHKKYLNDYFRGYVYGSNARGELYNDDPRLGDARLCGTTASLSGIEAAEYEKNQEKLKRGIALDIMLHAFLLTQSGIPVLYSGDEIGMLNDYTYHDNPLRASDSRYLHRGYLNWDEVKRRKTKGTRQNQIFTAIDKLRKLRFANEVFHSEADTWIVDTSNDHVLGIGRYYNGQKLIAFFNFSKDPQKIYTAEREEYKNMLTRTKTYIERYELGGYEFAWLVKKY